jgi:nicotinamidase-related amidase
LGKHNFLKQEGPSLKLGIPARVTCHHAGDEAPSGTHAPIVVKNDADSFFKPNLEQIASEAEITDIYLTGMMTQHCVTHTALSPQAGGMKVHIIAKGCAAPAKALSDLALQGLSARCNVV